MKALNDLCGWSDVLLPTLTHVVDALGHVTGDSSDIHVIISESHFNKEHRVHVQWVVCYGGINENETMFHTDKPKKDLLFDLCAKLEYHGVCYEETIAKIIDDVRYITKGMVRENTVEVWWV